MLFSTCFLCKSAVPFVSCVCVPFLSFVFSRFAFCVRCCSFFVILSALVCWFCLCRPLSFLAVCAIRLTRPSLTCCSRLCPLVCAVSLVCRSLLTWCLHTEAVTLRHFVSHGRNASKTNTSRLPSFLFLLFLPSVCVCVCVCHFAFFGVLCSL